MPDGLLFDPEPYLVQYLKNRTLLDAKGTPELDDDTGRALLTKEIVDEFVSVVATPWRYCLYRKGAVGAACETTKSPAEDSLEQYTCGRCPWLATGPENIELWQTSVLMHQDIVEHPLHPPLLKKASSALLEIAARILARHGLAANGAA